LSHLTTSFSTIPAKQIKRSLFRPLCRLVRPAFSTTRVVLFGRATTALLSNSYKEGPGLCRRLPLFGNSTTTKTKRLSSGRMHHYQFHLVRCESTNTGHRGVITMTDEVLPSATRPKIDWRFRLPIDRVLITALAARVRKSVMELAAKSCPCVKERMPLKSSPNLPPSRGSFNRNRELLGVASITGLPCPNI
jgi:hypothetical protein